MVLVVSSEFQICRELFDDGNCCCIYGFIVYYLILNVGPNIIKNDEYIYTYVIMIIEKSMLKSLVYFKCKTVY